MVAGDITTQPKQGRHAVPMYSLMSVVGIQTIVYNFKACCSISSAFPTSLSHLFFINFHTIQYYYIIFCPLVMLPYPNFDDFLGYGTLLPPGAKVIKLFTAVSYAFL